MYAPIKWVIGNFQWMHTVLLVEYKKGTTLV